MKVEDHPLFVEVALQIAELVERLEKMPGFRELLTYKGPKEDEPKPPVLDSSLDEKYATRVFCKLNAVSDCINRMGSSITLINNYPSNPSYPDRVITRSEWMDYHLSQCIVNLSTLLDVSIRLIEAVYDLGIPEKQCSKS
jgi:hypothetical protein